VYSKILSWAVAQCPDVELSGITAIDAKDVTFVDLCWVHEYEECHSAIWGGCKVDGKVALCADVELSGIPAIDAKDVALDLR
jgi:hypothetical protein